MRVDVKADSEGRLVVLLELLAADATSVDAVVLATEEEEEEEAVLDTVTTGLMALLMLPAGGESVRSMMVVVGTG